MSTIAKKIIIEELTENTHPEKVEDVIFWALSEYTGKQTMGSAIAYSIVERVKAAEGMHHEK